MFKYLGKGLSIIAVLCCCLTGALQAKTADTNYNKQGRQATCDVTFSSTPTFGNMCAGGSVQQQIYTITNNVPNAMKLNYIKVVNANGSVNPNATIGVAPTNRCGTSLAAGASCNIEVDINPTTAETFNLLLQIGIDSRQGILQTSINASALSNCSFSATTVPTFTDLCVGGSETGVFTFTNNSTIPVGINSIGILNADLYPTSTVTINSASVNSCSTSSPVAAGGSCNVTADVLIPASPAPPGIITRTLQFSANNNQQQLSEPISLLVNSSCTFAFSAPLPFVPSTLLCATPTFLTYIIKNNSPTSPEPINSIALVSADLLPANAATIQSNSCGSSLATGASCQVIVELNGPCTPPLGPLNRTLQVITPDFGTISAPTITTTFTTTTPPPPNYLGNAADCAVLAGTTVTNVPAAGTVITNGDVCVAPGTSITGFGLGQGVITPPGSLEINTSIAQNAQLALGSAITTLAALPCSGANNLTGQDLGGLTLTSGVYCFNSSAQLTGTLTLSGGPNDVFVFQMGSTLTTASASQVILTGGVLPENVYWVEGSAATLGTGTQFQGNILASTSITLNTGVNLALGRALAQAAVTLDSNLVTAP